MSFFFQTISIPAWFIVFVLASASPLWFKWYMKFHKKYISTGFLKRKLSRPKSDAKMKEDILKKATEHRNDNSELSGFSDGKKKKRKTLKKQIDPIKKQNIKIVLKELAASGETGILPKSLSDKAQINSIETTNALKYLTEKKYAESISGTTGTKYYLTDLGRRYCLNKQYL